VLAAALPQLAQRLGQGRGKGWEMGISLKKWGEHFDSDSFCDPNMGRDG